RAPTDRGSDRRRRRRSGIVGLAGVAGRPGGVGCEQLPLRNPGQGDGQHDLARRGRIGSDAAVNGSYSFKVASGGRGGSSNINQGGPFAAKAKEMVTLGTVSVGPGASFNATLTVT